MGFSYIAFDDVFLERFAEGFWEKHRDEPVGDIWIFLPSARSVGALKKTLIRQSGMKTSFLLPKIIPLGNVHGSPDVLGFIQQYVDLPETITMQSFTLMVLDICLKIFPQEMEQPSRLVSEFILLHQKAIRDQVDWKKLSLLVPDSYAQHWQHTLETLEKLLEEVDCQLKGRLDPASFQIWVHHQLQHLLPTHWVHPVYMVGSTGALPSIRKLHRVVGKMDLGQVILPGWDLELMQVPLPSLTHPLAPLVLWSQGTGVSPEEVTPWHKTSTKASPFLPAFSRQEEGASAVTLNFPHFTASYEYEEARFIAGVARHFLEKSSSEETLAVITPCLFLREMIQRYAALWGFQFTDDTPNSLQDSNAWDLIPRLIRANKTKQLSDIIGFLSHPYVRKDIVDEEALARVEVFARQHRLSHLGDLVSSKSVIETRRVLNGESIREAMERIHHLWETKASSWPVQGTWQQWVISLQQHIIFWTEGDEGREDTWRLMAFFHQVIPQMTSSYQLGLKQVETTLKPFLEGLARQIFWKKPLPLAQKRLMLLGPLEARLLPFSQVIVAGLNDGIWPADTTSMRWLSEMMSVTLGFSPQEREKGQSAQDFLNCLHHPKVLLTRSEERQGNPATPSFFWSRVTNTEPTVLSDEYESILAWIKRGGLEEEKSIKKTFDWPCPPVSVRPKKFSATRIDLLQRNPYEFYCRQILHLNPLPSWAQQFLSLDYGIFVHRALEDFMKEGGSSVARLRQLGETQWIQIKDPWVRKVFSLKFGCSVEVLWRMIQEDRPAACFTEQTGRINLSVGDEFFELNAKADRIDFLRDGTIRIVDYKTGSIPSRKDVLNCNALQLSVEALIHHRRGFEGGKDHPLGGLAYWRLTTAFPGLEIRHFSAEEVASILEKIEPHLEGLLQAFQSPHQSYAFIPQLRMGYDPYRHLSRWEA